MRLHFGRRRKVMRPLPLRRPGACAIVTDAGSLAAAAVEMIVVVSLMHDLPQ
jgi:hypothetical protein